MTSLAIINSRLAIFVIMLFSISCLIQQSHNTAYITIQQTILKMSYPYKVNIIQYHAQNTLHILFDKKKHKRKR